MHTNAILRFYMHCTHQLGGYTKHSWVMVSVIVAGAPAFAVYTLRRLLLGFRPQFGGLCWHNTVDNSCDIADIARQQNFTVKFFI